MREYSVQCASCTSLITQQREERNNTLVALQSHSCVDLLFGDHQRGNDWPFLPIFSCITMPYRVPCGRVMRPSDLFQRMQFGYRQKGREHPPALFLFVCC